MKYWSVTSALIFSFFIMYSIHYVPTNPKQITCTVQKWDSDESVYRPHTIFATSLEHPNYIDALQGAFLQNRNVFHMATIMMFLGVSVIIGLIISLIVNAIIFMFGICCYMIELGRAYDEAVATENATIGVPLREKDD
ncbi:MAG: hypothetical protein ACOVQN_02935 [Exiguobacterium sp.]